MPLIELLRTRYIVMAYGVMANIVLRFGPQAMAHMVMAHMVMAYIVMAWSGYLQTHVCVGVCKGMRLGIWVDVCVGVCHRSAQCVFEHSRTFSNVLKRP